MLVLVLTENNLFVRNKEHLGGAIFRSEYLLVWDVEGGEKRKGKEREKEREGRTSSSSMMAAVLEIT